MGQTFESSRARHKKSLHQRRLFLWRGEGWLTCSAAIAVQARVNNRTTGANRLVRCRDTPCLHQRRLFLWCGEGWLTCSAAIAVQARVNNRTTGANRLVRCRDTPCLHQRRLFLWRGEGWLTCLAATAVNAARLIARLSCFYCSCLDTAMLLFSLLNH